MDFNKIKPVNLDKYTERHKERQLLLANEAAAIYDYLDKAEESLEYYNYAIEYWHLTINNQWDDIIEKILIDKLNYLKSNENLDQTGFEKYTIKLQLNQKTLNYLISFKDEEYISILKAILKDLDIKIITEQNNVKKKRFEIKYFYTLQSYKLQTMGNIIKMSKEDIIKATDQMLKDYEMLIKILEELREALKEQQSNYDITDPLQKIQKERDAKEIFDLKVEIEAKRDLANIHFRERTDIFTKRLQQKR
jgi:hypothetical protein